MIPNRTASLFDCLVIRLLALSLLMLASANAEETVVAPPVTAFFQNYCHQCHGPKNQEGDFRVDQLKISATAADAENWQMVLDNLHLGEMPPEDAMQPKTAEVEKVTAWIQSEISRAAAELKGTGGEVVLRRLNRVEYENTIASLTYESITGQRPRSIAAAIRSAASSPGAPNVVSTHPKVLQLLRTTCSKPTVGRCTITAIVVATSRSSSPPKPVT